MRPQFGHYRKVTYLEWHPPTTFKRRRRSKILGVLGLLSLLLLASLLVFAFLGKGPEKGAVQSTPQVPGGGQRVDSIQERVGPQASSKVERDRGPEGGD
ncbi:MAG: hypothetical protein HY998_07185 [candidate division NC10 bacterium]|nr:hypothetical protein [candidate division NC10 bacterium]